MASINPRPVPAVCQRSGLGEFLLYLAKTMAIVLLLVLLRASMARLRIDQTLRFCWTIMTPVGDGADDREPDSARRARPLNRTNTNARGSVFMKKKRESVQRPGGLRGRRSRISLNSPPRSPCRLGARGFKKATAASSSTTPQNCINCVLCMRDCPTGAITIENKGTKEEKDMHAYLNVGRCVFCCQCVDTCPKKCLQLQQSDVMLASFSRDKPFA